MRKESVPLFTREYFSSRIAHQLVRYGLQTGCSSQGLSCKGLSNHLRRRVFLSSPKAYGEGRLSGCSLSFHSLLSNSILDASFHIKPTHVWDNACSMIRFGLFNYISWTLNMSNHYYISVQHRSSFSKAQTISGAEINIKYRRYSLSPVATKSIPCDLL